MISVVISAHNEEKNIQDCIASVEELATEIIVVDNSSTDKTYALAKKSGAIVFSQANNPLKIDLQKNFGFEKAKEEWILSLDADERVTPKLAQEIGKIVAGTPSANGFWIPRKNIIFGKWIKNSIWWPDYQLRLFRRGKGKFTNTSVHQPIDIKGETRHLSEPLSHKSYDSIHLFVSRMNSIYTEVEADEIFKLGKKLHFTEAVEMPVSDFLKTFFLQKGYRDGLHGFVLSTLQAFYMFLVFAKVWERQGFYERDAQEVLHGVNKEFYNSITQSKFWFFTTLQNESRNLIKKLFYLVSKKLLK